MRIIANDGTEFKTPEECLAHEKDLAEKEAARKAKAERLKKEKDDRLNAINATILQLQSQMKSYEKDYGEQLSWRGRDRYFEDIVRGLFGFSRF